MHFSSPLFIALVVFIIGCGSPETPTNDVPDSTDTTAVVPSGKFLNLSDIHFDPYYDTSLMQQLMAADASEWQAIFESSSITTLSTYHADANYPLLISSIKKMKAEIPNPDFIMVSGDYLAHEFESKFEKHAPLAHATDSAEGYAPLHSFINKTIAFVWGLFEQYYPNVPVYAALGNNDAYCGDYMIQPNGGFLSMSGNVFKGMLQHSAHGLGSFDTTYPVGGYYAIPSTVNPKLKFVVLNTILMADGYNNSKWTVFCTPADLGPNSADPGLEMLQWFKQQLEEARTQNEKVWVVQHIPPGINVYPSLPTGSECVGDTSYFFTAEFNTKYLQIINDYADVIATNMAGHYHKDDFRLIRNDAGQVVSYMHVLPSISPIYDNNPGFEVVDYDPESGALNNYTVYYVNVANSPEMSAATWALEYRFDEVYGTTGINTTSLTQAFEQLKTDTTLQQQYMLYYPVSDTAAYAGDLADFKFYHCGMGYMTKSSYADCCCN